MNKYEVYNFSDYCHIAHGHYATVQNGILLFILEEKTEETKVHTLVQAFSEGTWARFVAVRPDPGENPGGGV